MDTRREMGDRRSWEIGTGTYTLLIVFSHSVYLTLCDPTECSPPGSSVPGISQARILEGMAISFFRGSSRPRDRTCISCVSRQVLYHRVIREAHTLLILYMK